MENKKAFNRKQKEKPIKIRWKINVMDELKKAGFTPTRIRQENRLGQSYLQQLRNGELVSWAALGSICEMLMCQPGDLLEYCPEEGQEDITIENGID